MSGVRLAIACALAALSFGCDGVRSLSGLPSLEEGRELYDASGCGSCHGVSGRGDGPVSLELASAPRDFGDRSAFAEELTLAGVSRVLEQGSSFGGGWMPPFAHFNARERQSLALYVLSLRDNATDQPTTGGGTIAVGDAWSRPTLPTRTNTVAYFTVRNETRDSRRIVGATSETANTVELHRMVMENEIMRMESVEAVELPPTSAVEFDPGGLHLMVFGLEEPLAPGDSLALELILDDGTRVRFDASVRVE